MKTIVAIIAEMSHTLMTQYEKSLIAALLSNSDKEIYFFKAIDRQRHFQNMWKENGLGFLYQFRYHLVFNVMKCDRHYDNGLQPRNKNKNK